MNFPNLFETEPVKEHTCIYSYVSAYLYIHTWGQRNIPSLVKRQKGLTVHQHRSCHRLVQNLPWPASLHILVPCERRMQCRSNVALEITFHLSSCKRSLRLNVVLFFQTSYQATWLLVHGPFYKSSWYKPAWPAAAASLPIPCWWYSINNSTNTITISQIFFRASLNWYGRVAEHNIFDADVSCVSISNYIFNERSRHIIKSLLSCYTTKKILNVWISLPFHGQYNYINWV